MNDYSDTGRYRARIGVEIHLHPITRTKLFCACRVTFGDAPNSNVCPICLGLPGVLPALNEAAIQAAYVVARALNCRLSTETTFERKHYYYPDLPKNYQISQFGSPIGEGGAIALVTEGGTRTIDIRELHLEEDAGKMIHTGDVSLIDYNRAGTPLLEVVTEPDLRNGHEVELLLLQMRRLVRSMGVGTGNMEEGALRCDANVSLHRPGEPLGLKVEIKNMNSAKFVRKAIDFEIERQRSVLESGGIVVQETRLWNENRDSTESMRVKEQSEDYRFFPEPDLPPFRVDPAFLAAVEAQQVEAPEARKQRFSQSFGLSAEQTDFLCEERTVADFFERCVELGSDPALVARWLAGDVQRLLRLHGTNLVDGMLTPERLHRLLTLLGEGRIHGKIAKQVLEQVFREDLDPQEIVDAGGWERIGSDELIPIIDSLLEANQQVVKAIRGGNRRPIGWLIGEVMRQTSGRADPKAVRYILDEKIGEGT